MLSTAATIVLLAAAAVGVSLTTLRLGIPIMDEGATLSGAIKLLKGGMFYRDVDAYPLPGAWYLLAAVMSLFGKSLMTARVLNLAIYAGMVVVSYLAVRRVASAYVAAAYGVSLIALKYWAWPVWTEYVYPDLAIALAMAGILVFMRSLQGPERWPAFAAGLLFGAAAFCKQTVGIYPGLTGFALLAARGIFATRGAPAWSQAAVRSDAAGARPFRALSYYALGAVLPLGVPLLYFAAHGLGGVMVTNALLRPFTGYLPLSGLPYTRMLKLWEFGRISPPVLFSYLPGMSFFWLDLRSAAIHAWPAGPSRAAEAAARLTFVMIPLGFVGGAVLLGRALLTRPPVPATARALALYLLAGGVFLSLFPRGDYLHVIDVGPAWLAVLFLAGHLIMSGAGGARWRSRLVGAAMALGAVTALVGGLLMLVLMYRACSITIELPNAGRMRVAPKHKGLVTIVNYIRSHTKPGEPLFVLGPEAYYYFLCDRYSPWRFPQLFPGQSGGRSGREVADLIAKHRVPYVIEGNTTLPGIAPIASYAPSLVRYVETHYREVELQPGPENNSCGVVLKRVN
jgi:hypothetical protein